MVDENLPPNMARCLQALFKEQHEIIALRDKFDQSGISDTAWITTLGKEGSWCVLTADLRISKNKIERNAFLSNNLVGFVMAPALRKLPLTRQLARILFIWDQIETQSNLASNGLFEFGIRGNKFKQL